MCADQPSLQAQQLRLVLPAVTSVLTTVKSLKLSLPFSRTTTTANPSSLNRKATSPISHDDPYELLLLAGMFNAVRFLSIAGSPAPLVLQLLGYNVTNFEFVAPHLHVDAIGQLHELLPCLHTLNIIAYTSSVIVSNGGPYNLSKLKGVRHLEATALGIEDDIMWTSFPPNLMQLSCSFINRTPPHLMPLLHVLSMSFGNAIFTLEELAQLLRAAPMLKILKTGVERVEVASEQPEFPPDASDIEALAADLTLVHDKHAAGVIQDSLSIVFDNCKYLLLILQAVDVLSAFTHLTLEMAEDQLDSYLLGLVSTVFPNLEYLGMKDGDTTVDEDMLALRPLEKLHELSLSSFPLLTWQGLTVLCSQLRSLHMLRTYNFDADEEKDFEEGELLTAKMTESGRHNFIASFC